MTSEEIRTEASRRADAASDRVLAGALGRAAARHEHRWAEGCGPGRRPQWAGGDPTVQPGMCDCDYCRCCRELAEERARTCRLSRDEYFTGHAASDEWQRERIRLSKYRVHLLETRKRWIRERAAAELAGLPDPYPGVDAEFEEMMRDHDSRLYSLDPLPQGPATIAAGRRATKVADPDPCMADLVRERADDLARRAAAGATERDVDGAVRRRTMGTLSEQDRMVLRGLASTVSPPAMGRLTRDYTND